MYKTMLVHVDATPQSAQRVACCARLALRYDAHVLGVAATGVSPYAYPYGGFDAGLATVAFPLDVLRADADNALAVFEQQAMHAGLAKIERRRVDDEAGTGISTEALYADLVVVSQPLPDGPLTRLRADSAEVVLLHCPRPALVVPCHGFDDDVGRRIVIGWNGSIDAARAVASAIPLLQAAAEVTVLMVNPEEYPHAHGAKGGADLALYLARHDVNVEAISLSGNRERGEALLTCAADCKADLIVMGAYGHARMREIMLGGTTQTVLRSSLVPVWMAH